MTLVYTYVIIYTEVKERQFERMIYYGKPNKNNKLGIKGIWHDEKRDHYVAFISYKGKQKILKRSKDLQECISARKEAEEHINKDFNEWYENIRKSIK